MNETPLDARIDSVVQLLTRLAAGDLTARGTPSDAYDDLDAIIVGVNMLAEELEASRDELEDRVRVRTSELEQLNRDITQLTELGNLLQACENVDEAFTVMRSALADIFDGLSGSVYLFRASRNVLELKLSWGDTRGVEMLAPTECWALRRGQPHLVHTNGPSLACRHHHGHPGDSLCIPMSANGEVLGLLHLMDTVIPINPELPFRQDMSIKGDVPTHSDVVMDTGVAVPSPHLAGPRLTKAKQGMGLAVSEQTAMALANLELREKLRLQALRDPLTGLLNRRFVEEWINREVARTDYSGRSFGVIMADIDHFKQINDVHGHDAGDQLLKAVADAIRSALRTGDLPCRYGGEEFLLMLADIDIAVLTARADEVRIRVAEVRVEHRGAPLPGVTLSVGIALYPENGSSAPLVIEAADAALYAAKRNGRNQVISATRYLT